MYESGFRWVTDANGHGDGPRKNLIAPSGRTAATVYLKHNGFGCHNWHVWDEQGCGGENSSEPTVEAAMITAESAVLRWGQHFMANETREDEDDQA